MREEPLYIVTDQGPATGIGVYAETLANLLRGTFPNLTLLSLCYLPGQERPMWRRLPQSRVARQWHQIPFVMHHNYLRLRKEVSPGSRIHFCGTGYRAVVDYPRSVVTVHDYYPRAPTLMDLRSPRILLRDLSALKQFIELPHRVRTARARIVPTRYVQERLYRGCSLSSTAIHHWIDPSRFHPRDSRTAREKLGLPLEEMLVLNVSTGSSNKNYTLLTKVAGKLKKGYRMVLAGGKYSAIPKAIQLPRLPHDLYPQLFNACDAYLHASTQEGFGRPLIEAMASDLPVVALRTEVSMEVLGDAALYVDPNRDTEQWTEGIYRILDDPLRTEMIARERIRRPAFSSEIAKKAYENVYVSAFS
jgi:glycosyltransferase involved in cell wall biosynthesis